MNNEVNIGWGWLAIIVVAAALLGLVLRFTG